MSTNPDVVQRAVRHAAEQVLAPPFHVSEQLNVEILHGVHLGYAARVSCRRSHLSDDYAAASLGVTVTVDAPTYGIILDVSSRAKRVIHLGSTPAAPDLPTWIPEFRERFQVAGAPGRVLQAWLDPTLQAILVQSLVSHVSCENGVLEVGVPLERASDANALRAGLDVAVELVARLPQAIQVAGAGQFLVSGSLASHPDVLDYHRQYKRRVGKAVLLVSAIVCFLLVAIASVVVVAQLL